MADPFLDSQEPLVPGGATAALILVEGGRYLLQHRDSKPHIFFPDHWGLFGGATDPGESDAQGLRRELNEELGLDFSESDFRYFTRFDFDFAFCGLGPIRRIFFEIGPLPLGILDRIVLREGQAAKAFTAREALGSLRLTPYDNFALWMHASQARLRADNAG
jgi:8-oxo-dGTP pyrophosphatase MutT (NUDIX family)